MKIRDLKRYIEEYDIPDSAEIIIYADTDGEDLFVEELSFTRCKGTLGKNTIWEDDISDIEDVYTEESLQGYDRHSEVTAICLSGFRE